MGTTHELCLKLLHICLTNSVILIGSGHLRAAATGGHFPANQHPRNWGFLKPVTKCLNGKALLKPLHQVETGTVILVRPTLSNHPGTNSANPTNRPTSLTKNPKKQLAAEEAVNSIRTDQQDHQQQPSATVGLAEVNTVDLWNYLIFDIWNYFIYESGSWSGNFLWSSRWVRSLCSLFRCSPSRTKLGAKGKNKLATIAGWIELIWRLFWGEKQPCTDCPVILVTLYIANLRILTLQDRNKIQCNQEVESQAATPEDTFEVIW